jgi:hypothetical protein
MAIRRFSTASISTGNSKSTKLWDQETFQSGMFALATVSLSAGSSSVAFSGIPSNYTHLQIRGILRDNTSAYWSDCYLTFNSSGTGYRDHYIVGNGSGAEAGSYGYTTVIENGVTPGASLISNNFGSFITDILDYANTSKYKTVRTLMGYDNNGTGSNQQAGAVIMSSGMWQNTDAISSVHIRSNGTLQPYSHFALYGIRTA